MIGKIILGTYIGLEVLVHILLWGKKKSNYMSDKIGIKSLLAFILDVIIVSLGIIYW